MVVDFRALSVARPLTLWSLGQSVRLLDTGSRWLRVHPHGSGEGVTRQGFPWHDDLSLDVLGRVDSATWVVTGTEFIAQEESQEALAAGLVSAEQVRANSAEAERVQAALLTGTFGPLRVAREHLGLSQS